MLQLFGQSKLALQQRTTATGVHYPAGLDLAFTILVEDAQVMRVALRLQGNLLHFASIQKGNPLLLQFAAKGILKAAPVKLVRREGRFRNLAIFHAPGNILVAISTKEHTQAKFAQMLR